MTWAIDSHFGKLVSRYPPGMVRRDIYTYVIIAWIQTGTLPLDGQTTLFERIYFSRFESYVF